MALSAAQCRAARALLGWSQDELAEASAVAKTTIAVFEAGKRTPYDRTLSDLVKTLEAGGVIFIPGNGDGPGVRLKRPAPAIDAKGPATQVVKAMDAAIEEHEKSVKAPRRAPRPRSKGR